MTDKDILSIYARRVPSSGTLKMNALSNELEAKGKKIIHLEIGEPNFNTPEEIIEAAYIAMKEGKTGYTSSKGIAPLLERIAEIHTQETGVEIKPKENVITTPGAKAALFNALTSLINPEENVIVISPYWPSYTGIIDFIGATSIVVDGHYTELDFPFEDIKNAINSKSKAIIINSPSNPTGAIYNLEALRFIKDISEDHNVFIISDEIYKKIIFEGTYHQFLSISGSLERTIIIDGLSKSHAMTGWRFGYALANKELISAMNKIQQNISTCVNTPTQWAAIKALEDDTSTKKMVVEYKKRRDMAMELIEQCENLSCQKPEGAFYLFLKYKGFIPSRELALKLLEETNVCLTAGAEFGVVKNYLRISLASDPIDILEGIKRINDYLSQINNQ